ncbi:MAG TPA: right-handed parallel beta-helix repeat-containing protein [bacterium]|nr:right-handed parallel beta-helix repeat-containing protein [bacterium]
MTSRLLLSVLLLLALQPKLVPANVIQVPEEWHTIQLAINHASDGDVISVWGPPPGQSAPPYIYDENVNFGGRDLVVASRCFLPGWQGCTPTWDSVVIDGRDSGPVVTMTGSENSVVKGFTIRNGRASAGFGGGVTCNAGSILNNHILGCYSDSGGGGVYYGGWWVGDCWIEDNLIENNSAPGGGGGILVWAGHCNIHRDTVRHDTTVNRGGGIELFYHDPWGALVSSLDTSITGNVVDSNHLTGSNPEGGGILAWNWPYAARRNVVRGNDSNGIYVYSDTQQLLDLGQTYDPGLNVLTGNGDHDLVAIHNGSPVPRCNAVGNYWGYLDTHTILGRILHGSMPLNYDPVAASSKWFDVNLVPTSTCSTGVLVTGDLRVFDSLTIVKGESLEFYDHPDKTFDSGYLTELIVTGSDAVLTAVGASDDTIKFVEQTGPDAAPEWYGIRVLAHAYAQFDWCEIKRAYSGIHVERPGGRADVADSKIDSCEFAGAYGEQGSLDVSWSNVSNNEVYGVRYVTHSDSVLHCGVANCSLNYNGYAGVSIDGPATSSVLAPSQIGSNVIDAGGMTAKGIEAADNASWTSIEDNQVSACDQAGIAITSSAPGVGLNQVSGCNYSGIWLVSCSSTLLVSDNQVSGCNVVGIVLDSSSAGVVSNTVQNNTDFGIACLEGSNPKVRSNTVSQHYYGVYCDPTSEPDLGTLDDPGNNRILTDNNYWVDKLENPLHPDSVMALYNWWGTDSVDYYAPTKFEGPVIYNPWLHNDPMPGGGQQGAGAVSLRLVTGLDRLQPMPMRSMARIPFQVARAGQVALSITDATGRRVRTLVHGERGAGRYNLTWNRTDDRGRRVAAGVYFCTLDAEKRHFCRKVVLTD